MVAIGAGKHGVEDEKGRRFWLYRERTSEGAPHWFVHGLFA